MSRATADESPLTLALAAHDLVQEDPAAAASQAADALESARASRDREAEAAALHALGFARVELGDPRAIRTLRAAVRVAERSGQLRRAALARRPLSVCLAYTGGFAAGLRELDLARAALSGVELARTEVFHLAVLGLAGRAPVSLEPSRRALRTLRRAGDVIWEARLLKNRGELLTERGDAAAAKPDLERARDLYASLGKDVGAINAEILLIRLSFLRGDIVECLKQLDDAERRPLPARSAWDVELTRAEALVAARLLPEARRVLAAALALWERAGVEDYLSKGRLDVARLSLLAGDYESTRALADSARRSFAAGRQRIHAARATGLMLAAAVAAGDLPASAIRSGRHAAAVLAASGWQQDALRLRLLVARAAVALGSLRVARDELHGCANLRRSGSAADRIDYWHAHALLRLAEGDRRNGERALRVGLRLLDDYRAALGASELRASVSRLGSDLASAGLRLALADRNPRGVLAWAERLRASALRLPRVNAPDDPELRAREVDLRRLGAQIRRAESADRSTQSLIAQQTRLETAIRRRTRVAAAASGRPLPIPQASEVAHLLGPRALVEYVELDGRLHAVTLVQRRLALHELGPSARARKELEWLRFALSRLAYERRGPGRAAALAGATASARALDEVLLRPLASVVDSTQSMVLVPTGSLHAIPWSVLPSLHGRPTVVAPSVAVWMGLESRTRARLRTAALIAGPRLRHATPEVERLAALYPQTRLLTGKAATTERALAALDGVGLAHFACHGQFRADNPLFSSLELADGSLTALQLQRLRRPPSLIVLSACDLALSDRHPGDELLGIAAALLGIGTRTIVASVAPIPDATAERIMVAFHSELAGGASPASALARVQADLPDAAAMSAAFVCLGAS
jgi:CHAT domain-containing protein